MVTYTIKNNLLIITDSKKSLFGKEKVKQSEFDLNQLTKIHVLINKPTNVFATMTLYFGKKKRGIFFTDRTLYSALFEDLKCRYPDVKVEQDTAGTW